VTAVNSSSSLIAKLLVGCIHAVRVSQSLNVRHRSLLSLLRPREHALRFLLADDNPAILEHVQRLIDDQHVITAISEPAEIIPKVESTRPDVIVLDISMGEISGIDVAKVLQSNGFKGKIIFLTVHDDVDFVAAALGAGGAGYVLKSCLSSDLLPAISAVTAGHLFVSPLASQL
jgi:DNA-binding NarL/FixJ family response regulator